MRYTSIPVALNRKFISPNREFFRANRELNPANREIAKRCIGVTPF
jgi:hypothetical protein